MDLILWRHAEAHDASAELADIDRPLTRRGQQQAARMGAWLDRHLPPATRVLCSSAMRTEQTAQALGRSYQRHEALRPGGTPQQLLQLAGWPAAGQPVLIVGHQPTLGATAALLLGMAERECAVRKGAAWWLRARVRDGQAQTVIVAVQASELL